MTIKYVGPRVTISRHGVDFNQNQEDKYRYLAPALELLESLNYDDETHRTHHYNADLSLSANEIEVLVKQYCPDFDHIVSETVEKEQAELDDEVKRIKANTQLCDIEREAYLKNHTMMHDYIVQRTVNAHVYYCIVHALAERLKSQHIDYLIVPMWKNFAHVLHSVHGVLLNQNMPLDSTGQIFTEGDKMFLKFNVKELVTD